MEKKPKITVSVTLNAQTFKRFALFDTFAVKKRGRSPALFSCILIAFSFAALLLRREQSGLIAAVLLVIGLGLPILYVGTFWSQLNVQVERFKLGKGRKVYTVWLAEEGVTVRNDQRQEELLQLAWPEIDRVYQRRDCVYLYVSREKAFLLPNGQSDASDQAVWQMFTEHMQAERLRGLKG